MFMTFAFFNKTSLINNYLFFIFTNKPDEAWESRALTNNVIVSRLTNFVCLLPGLKATLLKLIS
jgi:hypothetical protein